MDLDAIRAQRLAHAEAGLDDRDVDADPFVMFRRWFDDVIAAGLPEPTAMVLATVPAGASSCPSSRHVLLKDVSDGSFRWVTNRRSRKGRELAENPHASLTFPWFAIGRQVLVAGAVHEAPDADSDAYFATRPRESQVAAWASDQSEPVADRASLEVRWSAMEARFAGGPVPRPDHWGMYALVPTSIELWQQRPFRMHDRFLYQRAAADQPWRITRLCP